MLIETAWTPSRAKESYLTTLYHRLARRRGVKKAAVGGSHAILVMAYQILKKPTAI
jgi:hypothetical protein